MGFELKKHGLKGVVVLFDLLQIRQKGKAFHRLCAFPAKPSNGFRGFTFFKSLSQLHHTSLPHPIEEVICFGIKKNGATNALLPGIIMGKPPKAGFDAPEHNGCLAPFKMASDKVGVGDDRTILNKFELLYKFTVCFYIHQKLFAIVNIVNNAMLNKVKLVES